MSSRKKIALLIALVIIACLPLSYILWKLYVHRYSTFSYESEREIIRKRANLQEAMALDVAEYSNYSDIFDKPGFTPPQDPTAYMWAAGFINAEIIEYYNARFDNLTEKVGSKPLGVRFRYETNVSTWDRIRVVYVPSSEDAGSNGPRIQIQSLNGSVLLGMTTWGMDFAHWNGSEYIQISGEEVDFVFSKSYVVQMSLAYYEVWGSLAGFFVEVYQIVVMDEDFVPLFLCVEAEKAIS